MAEHALFVVVCKCTSLSKDFRRATGRKSGVVDRLDVHVVEYLRVGHLNLQNDMVRILEPHVPLFGKPLEARESTSVEIAYHILKTDSTTIHNRGQV